jgi:hypothetical protein
VREQEVTLGQRNTTTVCAPYHVAELSRLQRTGFWEPWKFAPQVRYTPSEKGTNSSSVSAAKQLANLSVPICSDGFDRVGPRFMEFLFPFGERVYCQQVRWSAQQDSNRRPLDPQLNDNGSYMTAHNCKSLQKITMLYRLPRT